MFLYALSGKERVQCEIYGKLIAAIIIHRIHAFYNAKYWNQKKREISMEKLYKLIQPRGIMIFKEMMQSISRVIKYLEKTIKKLIKNSLKGKSKTKKTTLETLNDLCLSVF